MIKFEHVDKVYGNGVKALNDVNLEIEKRELENLIIQNGKVMKTIELKDMADALVGALYSAQKNYQDVPYYLYEDQKTINTNKNNYESFIKGDQFLVDL